MNSNVERADKGGLKAASHTRLPRQMVEKGVSLNMAAREKTRRQGDDFVAEGIWLTAESIQHLLANQHQGGKAMNETLWKCDQLRAGQLYNRMMFDTQAEAEKFVQRMQQMEPDQMFSIEAIEASQIWN